MVNLCWSVARLLTEIEDLQNFMNDVGIVHKILPLLSRQSNDLVREVLALLDTLFFNANKHIQVRTDTPGYTQVTMNNVSYHT